MRGKFFNRLIWKLLKVVHLFHL